MKIHKNGFWENNSNLGHVHDNSLAHGIACLINMRGIKSLVDIGCGMGFYAKKIIQQGIYVEAYDGNPYTVGLTEGIGKVLDFSNPCNLGKTFDCVLSLEVGEHIDEKFENIFIDNLVNHANKIIIISWAIKGQSGDGHINCRNNRYIKNIFSKQGFVNLLGDELFLRSFVSNCWWFNDTLMVFYRPYTY